MKKTKLTRSLLAACSIVALSAVMYGCVHSGGGPSVSELDLAGVDTQDGATVEAATYSADDVPAALITALEGYTGATMGGQGDRVTIGDYTFTCMSDSCSVAVAPDGSHFTTTGTIVVSSYMEPPAPMPMPMQVSLAGVADDATKMIGSVTIEAGMSADIGEVTFSCPAGGDACAVVVTKNDDGTFSATSTGGAATAANSSAYDARTAVTAVDLMGVADDAAMMTGSVTIGAGMSADIGEVTYSCPTGGLDCVVEVTTNDDGTHSATSTGGMATAANSSAYTMRKGEEEKARIAAATAAANTKTKAIADEAAQTTDAGLGGSGVTATGNNEGAYNLAIKRDRMATTVTVTVEGATDDDDEDFMLAADMMDGRTMHTRTMEADADGNVMTEVVIVATDIEAPDAVPFAMWESGLDGATPQALDTSTDTTNDTPTATNEALGVTTANIGLVASSAFTAGTAATLTFTDDDTNTADMDEAFEAAGTYNGSMGTYRCNGTSDCTVTLDAMGMITAMSTGWVFTPDAGATTDQPDYDYLHYGFWLKRTADKDGATTYNEVETFAMLVGCRFHREPSRRCRRAARATVAARSACT